jgi:hypothetical protein
MQRIDAIIDNQPTDKNCEQMVELTIRNKQASKELQHFEKNKTFLFEHPLLTTNKRVNYLFNLKHTNPAEFMARHKSNSNNIKFYKSQLKNKKYKSAEEKNNWQIKLNDYTEENNLITSLLNQ